MAPALAAKAATSTIPIVFASGSDPVGPGLVVSISRPGGNVTGVSFLATEVVGKQMAILRELLPSATVIGVPVNPRSPDIDMVSRDLQEASRALGFRVALVQIHSAGDFDSAFVSFVRQRVDAVLAGSDRLFLAGRHHLIVLAARHGLPTMFEQRESALAGGLISYGPSATESYRQAGSKPITGIAGCARAASGHAAAPPSSVMNSRRLIIRLPRRRWRAVSAAR